jgi:hypothetical protein
MFFRLLSHLAVSVLAFLLLLVGAYVFVLSGCRFMFVVYNMYGRASVPRNKEGVACRSY